MSLLTLEKLRRFAPTGRSDILQAIVDGEDRIAEAGITSPLRLVHFLAQTAVESAGFRQLEENLNYSAARLCQVWPRRFRSIAAATPFAHNPRALANAVYGGRLGNNGPDDGWRYRGSGLLQTTGLDNYEAAGHAEDPEALRHPETALDSALEFWTRHGCNALADRDDCEALTRKVNGGLNGLADRRSYVRRGKNIFRPEPAAMPVGLLDTGAPAQVFTDPTTVTHVSQKLRELGYNEVGAVDGDLGPRTQAAILAFRNDEGLPHVPVIDADFLTALDNAPARAVSEERATGKPDESRILSGSSTLGVGAGSAAGLGALTNVAQNVDISSYLDKAEALKGYVGRIKELAAPLAPFITVPNVLLFAGVIVFVLAWKIHKARVEDHRTGATP